MTFIAVVAVLEHVTGTFAEPCTLLNRHGEHWVNGVGGGEVFFERDEFHVFSLGCCLLCFQYNLVIGYLSMGATSIS